MSLPTLTPEGKPAVQQIVCLQCPAALIYKGGRAAGEEEEREAEGEEEEEDEKEEEEEQV